MTFEDFIKTKPFYINTQADVEACREVWNAAINAVIYELGDQAYVDNYAYKSGDPQYAEDVAKKLLTAF